MSSWTGWRAAALRWVILVGWYCCVCLSCRQGTLSSPTEALPAVVYAQWAAGQQDLAAYVGPRAMIVSPGIFEWTERSGRFQCEPGAPPDRTGCFWPVPGGHSRIEWSVDDPNVIRHEAGHAILFALGDARYACYSGGGTVHDPNCVYRDPRME